MYVYVITLYPAALRVVMENEKEEEGGREEEEEKVKSQVVQQ